jgi:hypothetical protein
MSAAAYPRTATAPKADASTASGGMMMNCPMMANMSGMQKDMESMMSEMQAMMKDGMDPAINERMQKMHERIGAMKASMQKMGGMGGMMSNMMGGQQTGNAAPAKPDTASPATPVSPEDHAGPHPGQ